jgi:hypothetical protein
MSYFSSEDNIFNFAVIEENFDNTGDKYYEEFDEYDTINTIEKRYKYIYIGTIIINIILLYVLYIS